MKMKSELNTLKEEVETVNEKLRGLTEEELAQVTGSGASSFPCGCASCNYDSKENCTYYKAVMGHCLCQYD